MYHESLVQENKRAYEIATRLDTHNPELRGAFTGTPTERIERQVEVLIFGESGGEGGKEAESA